MYSILTKEFHQADAVPWQPTDSEDEDDQEFERKKFQGNKELTELKRSRNPMERRFRISPATLRNELENNDVYRMGELELIILDEFLQSLVEKEYVWKLTKEHIKSFVKEVTDKILIEYDGKLPSKIDKDILVNAIPTEENFLIRIGHKIRSSDFLKLWKHYDVDHSGYLEHAELCKLIADFAEVTGEEASQEDLDDSLGDLLVTFDVNRDDRLELEELSHLMSVEDNFMKTFCTRPYLTRKDFDTIFSHYDSDRNGTLEKEEVMALLNDILKFQETKNINIPIPVLKEVYAEVMRVCDVDGSRTIEKNELAMLLTQL